MTTLEVYHADHGVSNHLIEKTLVEACMLDGFFCCTFEVNEVLNNALYGPVCGDEPILDNDLFVFFEKRSKDREPSKMLISPMRSTNKLTVIGIKESEHFKVFTAYGGPLAKREPWDPTLSLEEKEESVLFWKEHALSYDLLKQGTILA